jgi:hypothetical protein
MVRDTQSFQRKKPRFKQQPTTLILCEDTKSSLNYLKSASRHFRSYALVQILHTGKTDPLGIVREATKQRGKFDSVYCVIDRDSHHNFEEALAAAAVADVRMIVSYPCYEYWLLLHFRRTRKGFASIGNHSAADRLIKELRKEAGMDGYAKGSSTDWFVTVLPNLPAAIANSRATLKVAIDEQSMNPSTQMHELIHQLELLGAPAKV